ncbi:MAG: hypothetical protein ACP5OG_04210 [Candidatus Nanoarchaeia archaeon]
MKKSLALGIVIALLIINMASAGIYFSQPESTYNLGDKVSVDVEVSPLEEGFLKVDLTCSGDSLTVYNGIPGEKISIQIPLTYNYIEDMDGKCYFEGEYQDSSQKSNEFEISKKLNVNLEMSDIVVKPGESAVYKGTAKRLNGVGSEGEVKVRAPSLKLEKQDDESQDRNDSSNETEDEETVEDLKEAIFSGKISEGNFLISFKVEDSSPAGDYELEIIAYEKDKNGRITSTGTAEANLRVIQILKEVEIAISTQNIDPGQTLDIKPSLLDQSGKTIKDDMALIIKNQNLERVYEHIVKSGEGIEYKIPTNLTSGYYEIEASSQNKTSYKKFFINEKAIAFFELKNNTLVITSIGNVPYSKDVQIEINGKPFLRKLDLAIGEKEEFELSGPDGNYDIKVSDGQSEVFGSGIPLTGYAVGVNNANSGSSVFIKSPILWILLFVVLAGIVLFFGRNVLKKKSFAYPWVKKKDSTIALTAKQGDIAKTQTKQEVVVSKSSLNPTLAEQVLVIDGSKGNVSVVAIKLKNKPLKAAKENLDRLVQEAYESKACSYESGDFVYLILSPSLTKTTRNEAIAVKIADKIANSLKEWNKKFTEKMDFGIGVGSGDVISKIEDKKFKFTALGTFMVNLKKLASISNQTVLLSKAANDKGAGDFKAEKKTIEGQEVYELKRVVDTFGKDKFINDFLKREDTGKKITINNFKRPQESKTQNLANTNVTSNNLDNKPKQQISPESEKSVFNLFDNN